MQTIFPAVAAAIIQGLGIAGLCVFLCDTAERLIARTWLRQVCIGLAFGASASAATIWAVDVDGALIDGRGILLGAAGALGGFPGAAAAFLLASATRVHEGGPMVFTGLSGNIVATTVGLAWYVFRGPYAAFSASALAIFGASVSLHVLPVTFAPGEGRAALAATLVPIAAVGYAATAVAFGFLLARGRDANLGSRR